MTIEPAVGYGLAEAKGDVLSQSTGAFGVGAFGYNPISNNLGFTAAAGANGAVNPLNSDAGREWHPCWLGVAAPALACEATSKARGGG